MAHYDNIKNVKFIEANGFSYANGIKIVDRNYDKATYFMTLYLEDNSTITYYFPYRKD